MSPPPLKLFLYNIENEIDKYLGIKDFEQICGFIIGNPIYNYPPKIKKDLKDLLLN